MSMKRRTFLQQSAGALAAAAIGASRTTSAGEAPGKRPNILVVLADDMGYSDIGCYGGEIPTPNIDRLANEGLRFTQFYNAARCCPTRASLLTGLYPHQAGMGGMVSFPDNPRPPGPYQGYLNNQCVTIAEALRPTGYKTYMSGKWHVGEAPDHWPRQRGFDRYWGLISGASSYWEILDQPGRSRVMAEDDTPFTPEPGDFYMTDDTTDHAVKCLREHDTSKPFFQYLSYTAPHWPLHAWPEDIARYEGRYLSGWDRLREERFERMRALGILDQRWPLSPRDSEVPPWDDIEDKEWWAHLMAVYAAMMDRMDQGIGRVMDTLREIGEDENTLVLFLSDNGGCHESVAGRNLHDPDSVVGERGSYLGYKRPWANASNTPFRLFKHWIHEGGIATPLVARWPAQIRGGGNLTGQTGHIVDFMPTFLEMAGAEYPETHQGQPVTPHAGRSLLPIFRGEEREAHPRIYWEHMNNRAVRAGDWKLVSTKDDTWELYNLAEDRTELNNLIETEAERAETLLAQYDSWAERVGVNAER